MSEMSEYYGHDEDYPTWHKIKALEARLEKAEAVVRAAEVVAEQCGATATPSIGSVFKLQEALAAYREPDVMTPERLAEIETWVGHRQHEPMCGCDHEQNDPSCAVGVIKMLLTALREAQEELN